MHIEIQIYNVNKQIIEKILVVILHFKMKGFVCKANVKNIVIHYIKCLILLIEGILRIVTFKAKNTNILLLKPNKCNKTQNELNNKHQCTDYN